MTMADAADRLKCLRIDLPNMTRMGLAAALDDLESDMRAEADMEAARVAEGREAMAALACDEGGVFALLDAGD